jgi:hypothetical protein
MVRKGIIGLRVLGLASSVLMLASACSSGRSSAASTTVGPTTTTNNANLTPNSIPYVVGEPIGLPNSWVVTVTKVHRPYTPKGMAAAPSGEQYVAVDITVHYDGTTPVPVNAADLFKMVDGNAKLHDVVKEPTANGIDATYTANATHSGRLVFVVPPVVRLVLALDGPKIGTQRSIFTIDPPTLTG